MSYITPFLNIPLITQVDQSINSKMIFLTNPQLTKVMIVTTNIISPPVLLILSIVISIILVYKKRRHNTILLLITMVTGSLLVSLIKIAIKRTRPENALIEVSGYSFPSGHAVIATLFFSLLLYLFKNDIKNTISKYCFITVNLLLVLVVGFSRIYLHVHWFSDVVIGYIIGLLWIVLSVIIFNKITSHTAAT